MMAAVATYAGSAAGSQIYALASAQALTVLNSAAVQTFAASTIPIAANAVGHSVKIAAVYALSRPLTWACTELQSQVFEKCMDPETWACSIAKAHELTACTAAWATTASTAQGVGGFILNMRPW